MIPFCDKTIQVYWLAPLTTILKISRSIESIIRPKKDGVGVGDAGDSDGGDSDHLKA